MPQRFPEHFFRRIDESDDSLFYEQPRMVVHIDDNAIRTLGEIYAMRLKPGGEILDLMSSWRSHLPPALKPRRVVGLGMNRAEMEANPALSEVIVHDLNREPRFEFAGDSFDGATLCVSIQYLLHPLEVFAEVGRVLKPGAPFIVGFSNRMFPAKAVAGWVQASAEQRVALVRRYFVDSGVFENIEVIDRSIRDDAPLASDPIWAVIGYRQIVRG